MTFALGKRCSIQLSYVRREGDSTTATTAGFSTRGRFISINPRTTWFVLSARTGGGASPSTRRRCALRDQNQAEYRIEVSGLEIRVDVVCSMGFISRKQATRNGSSCVPAQAAISAHAWGAGIPSR